MGTAKPVPASPDHPHDPEQRLLTLHQEFLHRGGLEPAQDLDVQR